MPSNFDKNPDVIHVAVGVIFNDDGQVLLARRHDHLHQGGLWEFPGGKLESGENVQMALARELREELSIQVQTVAPMIRVPYRYPDKSVLLDVWQVDSFNGEPHGREGQPIRWVMPDELGEIAFPAANKSIVNALVLPHCYLITGYFENAKDFERRLGMALKDGIRLVQLRAKQLAHDQLADIARLARKLCQEYKARLIINGDPGELAEIEADGVHLNSSALHGFDRRPVAANCLLGASLHNQADVDQANRLDVDFAVLSPVYETQSHPGVEALGWQAFAELVEQAAFPVYALGGMTAGDAMTARRNGGQGVAAISAFWPALS